MRLNPSMHSLRVVFEGRVQGVGFRYEVKHIAQGYDVIGSVKNLPDGTVELLVSGEKQEVDEFIREICEESPLSRNISNTHSCLTTLPDSIKGFSITV